MTVMSSWGGGAEDVHSLTKNVFRGSCLIGCPFSLLGHKLKVWRWQVGVVA